MTENKHKRSNYIFNQHYFSTKIMYLSNKNISRANKPYNVYLLFVNHQSVCVISKNLHI